MGAIDYVPHGRLAIDGDATLRVDDGKGTLLHVWEGSVWLTQERDRRDHLLKAGESFRLDRAGATLISPLGKAALVSLTPPAPQETAPAFRAPMFAVR